MMKSSLPPLMSFTAITLFMLACSAVQINIQINTQPTSTLSPAVLHALPTQTLSATTVPLTVTFTSTVEPMPRLEPGQTLKISDLIMLGDTTGWGFEPGGHILHTLTGGKTWNDVTPPENSYYTKRTFLVLIQISHGLYLLNPQS